MLLCTPSCCSGRVSTFIYNSHTYFIRAGWRGTFTFILTCARDVHVHLNLRTSVLLAGICLDVAGCWRFQRTMPCFISLVNENPVCVLNASKRFQEPPIKVYSERRKFGMQLCGKSENGCISLLEQNANMTLVRMEYFDASWTWRACCIFRNHETMLAAGVFNTTKCNVFKTLFLAVSVVFGIWYHRSENGCVHGEKSVFVPNFLGCNWSIPRLQTTCFWPTWITHFCFTTPLHGGSPRFDSIKRARGIKHFKSKTFFFLFPSLFLSTTHNQKSNVWW